VGVEDYDKDHEVLPLGGLGYGTWWQVPCGVEMGVEA
jgi:hypothetical protein